MTTAPHPADALAGYADIAALPPHVVGEVIGGELHVSPRPRLAHADVQISLGFELHGPFRIGLGGPGGWLILPEPELHLAADEAVVPDLAGWRTERAPDLATTVAAEAAPDWVCEILSPATAGHDRLRKLPYYARHGVDWAWLVDPTARSVEVFQRQGEHYLALLAIEGAETVPIPPFDAVSLDLGRIWTVQRTE